MSGASGGPAKGGVLIAADRCKGCELCIDVCPPRVLTMSDERNGLGYAFPLLSEGCTGCTACQMVCPDFVFEVYRTPLVRSGVKNGLQP